MSWLVTLSVFLMASGLACDNDSVDTGSETDRSADVDSATTEEATPDSATADSTVLPDSVPVGIEFAVSSEISSSLPFSSTLETESAVVIFPRISGLVNIVMVEEGDYVSKADTLLAIEDDELRIALKESEVNVRHLTLEFERVRDLHDRRLVAEQDYEKAKFDLAQARLARDKAELNLQHTIVRAPFAGVITQRDAQIGARVDPSS